MIKHIYPKTDYKNGVYTYGKYIDKLVSEMVINDKDIIHVELGYNGYKEFWRLRKLLKAHHKYKFIVTLHDPPVVVGKPFSRYLPGDNLFIKIPRKLADVFFGKTLIKRTLQRVDAVIILNTNSIKVVSEELGVDKDKIFYLPHPIVIQPKPRNNYKECKDILFFGNITPRKRLDLILRAFIRIHTNYPKLQLTIAGDYSGNEAYYIKLKQFIKDNNLKNITFLGYVSNKTLIGLIEKANIVVLPYDDPGIIHASGPLTISMASGVAIVATNIPIFTADIHNGENGMLVEENNYKQLEKAILKICDSTKVREKMGSTAVNQVKKFNNDRIIATKLKGIYRQV